MDNIISPNFSGVLRTASGTEVPKEMLRVVRQVNGPTLVRINSSSLSLIQTCARKTFYSLKEGWRSKALSPPLVFGSAIHKALEVFYSHTKNERSFPQNFDEIAPLLAHGHEAPEPHFLYEALLAFVKAAQPLNMLPDTDKRSIASGVWTLCHYFKTYINDAYVIFSDERGPMVERTFSFPYYEDREVRIELFGTIDFALKNEATGEVLVGDHKTASQMGSDFLNRVKPNHQYTGYLIGAQNCLGIASENFLINGIQVKPKPMTARGGPPTFTRQITRRSQQDFDEFRDVLLWAVRSYLRWEETETWPLGVVDACSSWGGCGYLEVCSAPNSLRQNILEAKHTRGQNA